MTAEEFLDSETTAPEQSVRLLNYGPIVNEYHHAAMFGPQGNPLGPEDVAASPDLGLPFGQVVDLGDGRLRRIADASYLHPGIPTSRTIEVRDRLAEGRTTVKPVSAEDFLGPEPTPKEVGGAQPSAPQPAGAGDVFKSGGDPLGIIPKPPPEQSTLDQLMTFLKKPSPEAFQAPEQAARETLSGFIPKSLKDVGGLVTGSFVPIVQAGKDVANTTQAVRDFFQGKPLDEIQSEHFPDSKVLAEADKTAPFSLERYRAGFDILSQMGMAAGVAHGIMAGPKAAEEPTTPEPTVQPEVPTDITGTEQAARFAGEQLVEPGPAGPRLFQKPTLSDTALAKIGEEIPTPEEVIPNATQERQQPESNQPEYTGNAPRGTPAETSGRGSNEPSGQVQEPQETVTPETAPIGVAERYAEEELGQGTVVPGTREDAAHWRAKGREYINQGGDPRMPIRAANAGHTSPRNVGIVSAEHERLVQIRRQAADALEANPRNPQAQKDFTAADEAARSWRREMQPVLTRAGESLGAAIGQEKVDLGTFDGLHDAAVEATGGVPLSLGQKAALMKRAGKARQYRNGEVKAVAARDAVIQKTVPKVKPKSPPEMLDMVAEMAKRMTPC